MFDYLLLHCFFTLKCSDMKKFYVVLILIAFFITSCNKGNIPKEVKNSFQLLYNDVKEVEWLKQDDGNYLATFTKSTDTYKAWFDAYGVWIKTTKNIDKNKFPSASVEYIQTFYNEYEQMYLLVSDSLGDTYVVELSKDNSKTEAYFDMNGQLIKDDNNAVYATFIEKYPLATNTNWMKSDSGTFSVTFTIDSTNTTSIFANDGNRLKSTTVIQEKDYPELLLKYIKTQKGLEIKEVSKIENADGITYCLCGKLKDVEYCFLFDESGHFSEKKECAGNCKEEDKTSTEK